MGLLQTTVERKTYSSCKTASCGERGDNHVLEPLKIDTALSQTQHLETWKRGRPRWRRQVTAVGDVQHPKPEGGGCHGTKAELKLPPTPLLGGRATTTTGDDSCHGSKWLVAWEQVCTSKTDGGLGLKNLELQNHCLLLKFVDKLFTGVQNLWWDWLLTNDSIFSGTSSTCTSYL
jgi:hypothetical protein